MSTTAQTPEALKVNIVFSQMVHPTFYCRRVLGKMECLNAETNISLTMQPTNRLLHSLSHESRQLLLRRSTAVSLPAQTVFYKPGETPQYGWFLTSGLASIVAFTTGDQTTGVGRMGNEGVVGSLHLLGPGRIPSQCFMQMSGSALRIAFSDLQQVFQSSPEIRARLLELIQEQVAVLHQSAACHLHHEAKERFASCLLAINDRTQLGTLEITQKLFAEMLGIKRSTVSVLAGDLQTRGLIAYGRGKIRILDRKKLEAAACSCYPLCKKLHQSLYSQPSLPKPQYS